MNKISITIDLDKIDKKRVMTRSYTNKNGEQVQVRELKLDIIPVRQPKVVAQGDSWSMVKTHFVSHQPTREERQDQKNAPIVGDGIAFEPVGQQRSGAEIPF